MVRPAVELAAGGARQQVAAPGPVAVSDAFTVTFGCDKRFSTCRDRFANGINFRGFPAIPGNDFVISYPVPGSNTQG